MTLSLSSRVFRIPCEVIYVKWPWRWAHATAAIGIILARIWFVPLQTHPSSIRLKEKEKSSKKNGLKNVTKTGNAILGANFASIKKTKAMSVRRKFMKVLKRKV